jgi:protein-S-isoprenylcysteine O-methyltransferase
VSPVLRGAVAALLVGTVGRWNGPTVLSLALASGLSFFDLRRRARAERDAEGGGAIDWFGNAMQLAFLLVFCAGALENSAPEIAWRPPGWPGIAGLAVLLAGVWLRRSAAGALGRHFTVSLSVLADHELVATGPYRWLRHPNYAGLLLVAFGTAMMVWSPLAVGVTLALWLPAALLRIRSEERTLHERLGSAYADYARDRWCLVPGVY